MEDLPLVSIITPSYNQVRYLPATYQSVISQNYPNIEYLIVDGGSTDGSAELIRRWADGEGTRLSWWISEKDSGQAEAINKGFSRAKGEIVAWLNSDDLYMKDAIQKAVAVFKAKPGIGLIFSNVFSIDAESKLINVMHYGKWGLRDLMAFNIIGQPGVFIRREALDKAGFLDSTYHFLLDHHLWLRIAKIYKIEHIDDFYAAARYYPEAKNVALASEFSREAFRIVDWMKSRQEFSKVFADNRRTIMAGAYCFSARYLLDGGENGRSFHHYLKSFWYHPPTAVKELSRFLYSFLGYLPFVKGMKEDYLEKRSRKLSQDKIDIMYLDLSNDNDSHNAKGE